MAREPMKDIVVLLPGILGSVLEKDGKTVWGWSGASLGKALLTRGKSMREALQLPSGIGDAEDAQDGVLPTDLMPDMHFIPKLWKVDGYGKIVKFLRGTFELKEGENFFPFAYDWRLSNRATANRLARESHNWLSKWRESSNPDAKLILVGHSMGGLVSRYFLEVLEGWKDTRALITFGTPYRGSVNAIDSLSNGVRKGPLGLMDLTAMGRSLPSLYQLLPIYPCYDDGDGKARRVGEIDGIPNVDALMAADALAFHREISAAVDVHADPFGRYDAFPVVGTNQKTNQAARRSGDGVDIHTHELEGRDLSGDGTVPRVSATPIEYSDAHREVFVANKHGSLQNHDPTLVQLKGILTGYDLKLGTYLGPGDARVGLEVDDLYFDSEPIVVTARTDRADLPLNGTITNIETNKELISSPCTVGPDGEFLLDAGTLPEGAYRVTITGDDVESVADAFAVAVEPAEIT